MTIQYVIASETNRPVQVYRFFWRPEKRPLIDIEATSITTAVKVFRRVLPVYARRMSDVYWEVTL